MKLIDSIESERVLKLIHDYILGYVNKSRGRAI